jgi:hypothetical protein
MNQANDKRRALPVINLDRATFECVWPSCGGACCKESRPPISEGEEARIAGVVDQVLPMLRPEARRVVAGGGWLTHRQKGGRRTLAVASRYCVFYAEGCVLHRLGAAEGDKNKYKPATCITFPLDKTDEGEWYVRQEGVLGEAWDLDCLNPRVSNGRPTETLKEEMAFAERVVEGLESWRRG